MAKRRSPRDRTITRVEMAIATVEQKGGNWPRIVQRAEVGIGVFDLNTKKGQAKLLRRLQNRLTEIGNITWKKHVLPAPRKKGAT